MTDKAQRIHLLADEKISKALLKLGIPTMIGMLVSAFYNIVDAFFVGQLGTLQTAAVSIIYPLTMVGTGLGLLFGNGAGSYISRLLGRKAYDQVAVVASTTIFTGLGTIVFVAAGLLLCFDPLVNALGATALTMPYVREYGLIFIAGLILNVFNVLVNNLLIAEGATAFSMAAMLLGGLSNIFLDPLLIFGCQLGVGGAAIATLLARLISTALYLFYLLNGKNYITLSLHDFRPSRTLYGEIFKIGLPICVFQLLTGLSVGLTNFMARPFGEAAIAAMGIVNRIMTLESNALYGFLKGYTPLVGYNYGAGNAARIQQSTKTALLWSTSANILFGLLCLIFARPLIHLFNHQSAQVLEIGRWALSIDGLSFMLLGIQIVIGNYFLAIGKAKQGGMLSLSRQGFFFIPFLLIFTSAWGLFGLILAQPAADLCATLLTLKLWQQERRYLASPQKA